MERKRFEQAANPRIANKFGGGRAGFVRRTDDRKETLAVFVEQRMHARAGTVEPALINCAFEADEPRSIEIARDDIDFPGVKLLAQCCHGNLRPKDPVYNASAPLMISISSFVIAAWRVRL